MAKRLYPVSVRHSERGRPTGHGLDSSYHCELEKGSFLAVLKAFGKENRNLLSFPMEGYTLALDFKIEPDLFPLLDRLDAMVLDHGGRLYLTKTQG